MSDPGREPDYAALEQERQNKVDVCKRIAEGRTNLDDAYFVAWELGVHKEFIRDAKK